ncbi:MAG TPA: amidohydrolase family protein [Planctomycetaceae bacterium]|nr:amidohydrolase family protein [Planctomycetaceae bacterium]
MGHSVLFLAVSLSPMADTLIITNGTLVLPDQIRPHGRVVCRRGRIAAIESADKPVPSGVAVIDARGGFISPGFVDIHVHGGDGADFMDGTLEAVQTACRCHLRHGTTTIFPTTTTGSPEQLAAMINACKTAMQTAPAGAARIAGVHFYGPYFAANKVGCHNLAGQRPPARNEYERHFASGIIRIATCAAELTGAIEFYRFARRKKCLVTCGHSNSTWTEMAAAYQAGMRHVDHFWCAMSSVASLRDRCGTPMQASMEQFVLAEPEMSTEVIADGCHLSPELLRFAYQMKGPQRLCLVTDSSRALDLPPGEYRFGPDTDGEWFRHDGEVGRMLDGSALASSTAGMDRMVRTMAASTKAPLCDVIRMASLTPAERTGIDHDVGSLDIGKRADVLVLSKRLQVRHVVHDGVSQ